MKKSVLTLFAAILAFTTTALTFAAGEPENVTGLQASAVSPTSINLTWNPAKDANGGLVKQYRVFYDTVSPASNPSVDYSKQTDTPTNNTSYLVTGLKPATAHYFAVTAVDKNDLESEAYSEEASASTPADASAPADKTPPTVLRAVATNGSHAQVVFSEAVKLPLLLPETAFSVTEQASAGKFLKVTNAVIDALDASGKTVLLTTEPQTAGITYIVTAGVTVSDLAGNPMVSGNTDFAPFTGSALGAGSAPVAPAPPVVAPAPTAVTVTTEPAADTTPPENVTQLVLSFKKQLETFIVLMDWKASVNSAKDLVDQLVYMSLDRGKTYASGQSVGPVATHNEVAGLEGGKEYTFKVTTKDAVGNESVGTVKSIRLPQTGVGAGILVILSAAVANAYLKRRKV